MPPPAMFPAVFRPCRLKLPSCRSSVIGAWCPRAWELSALWCTRGPRFAFFRPSTVATGYMASDLCLGGTGDGACPKRATVRHLGLLPPLPVACFGVLCLFCLCVLLMFLRSQSACVWFKFYGNICWLIARSAIFL